MTIAEIYQSTLVKVKVTGLSFRFGIFGYIQRNVIKPQEPTSAIQCRTGPLKSNSFIQIFLLMKINKLRKNNVVWKVFLSENL